MSEFDLEQLFKGIREQLEADPAGAKDAGVNSQQLASALAHPMARAELERTLPIELASVAAGEPAPDFTLARLLDAHEGQASHVTLSDHFGKRPVALIFGSYT
jgi:hypothetical protein